MARKFRPDRTPLITRLLDYYRSRQPEFRQDTLGSTVLQKLYMTHQQRMRLLRWGCYILACFVAVILQDTIFSRLRIFGSALDLPACVLLLITVIEGTDTGSVFILFASVVYYFTGSSPGPHVVATMTILGMGAALLRQLYWHRSRGAILLCASTALMLYEIVTFGASIFSGLTHWGRLGGFCLTALLSLLSAPLLYPLLLFTQSIGGKTWKE